MTLDLKNNPHYKTCVELHSQFHKHAADVLPADPLTYAASSILVVFVALAASYLPAHRASRVDPMVALRYE